MTNTALFFPGQGSQKIGMYQDLYSSFSVVQDTFAEASDAIGVDLYQLIQNGPENDLNLTENTQPVLLSASIAALRVALELGMHRPTILAGHSLGEWSALVAADVVSFTDAVKLVKLRGRYMQEAVPEGAGAMAAIIGLDDEIVEASCAEASSALSENEIVSPVNYNSPGQLVIAGTKAAVDKAVDSLKAKGAKRALLLPVSAPFHTTLMRPAAERLAEDMNSVAFNDPVIPIIHNVHAQSESSGSDIKQIMIKQIYRPVRWVDCVRALAAKEPDVIYECGPGKVLTGLAKRIDRTLTVTSFDSEESLRAALS